MTLLSIFTDIAHKIILLAFGLLGIGFVIGFHELGHFIFCKIFNIRTPSFSIGFGPRLFEKKIGDTVFALSALPLGGYVEIAGAQEVGQGEQKEAYVKDERSFSSKPYYQKLLVMSGGILFNIIFTYCALALLFSFGMPNSPMAYPYNALPVIASVHPNTPAAIAGMQPEDAIIAVNNTPIEGDVAQFHNLLNMTMQSATLTILRQGSEYQLHITPQTTAQGKNLLKTIGVSFQRAELPPRGLLRGAHDALMLTHQWLRNTYYSFKAIFTGKNNQGLNGPIMIISETSKSAQKGIKTLAILLAFISIQLAVLNLIPLPILDGGQILFYTIEAIIGRPLPDQVRLIIHYICWAGLLALLVYVSFKDLRALFFK